MEFKSFLDYWTGTLDSGNNPIQIFRHLDFKSLSNCRIVCKTWHAFVDLQMDLWIELMKKARTDFLDEPKRYLSENNLCVCAMEEECCQWEALLNCVNENGTLGDIIIVVSKIRHAFRYSHDKLGQPLFPLSPLNICISQKSFKLLKVIMKLRVHGYFFVHQIIYHWLYIKI